jgi:N-acetylmuramoyl-L-alanine amidase
VSSKDLQLAHANGRVKLTLDSRRAEIRGIAVWLSHAVVLHQGTPHVSALDLQGVVRPLLQGVPRPSTAPRVRTICIDPGHGGHHVGYQVGPNQEKRATLVWAKDLGDRLRRAGFNVVYTRARDVYVDVGERPEIAHRRRADLFISLHFNSDGGGNGARGVETYCLTPAGARSTNDRGEGGDLERRPGNKNDAKNLLLAHAIQRSLVTRLGFEDRGVRRARFAVLRTAEMPAVLVEGGFLSDRAEAARILDPEFRGRMAQAVVTAIQEYKRAVEPSGS